MAWKFNPFTGTLDIATTNPVTASAVITDNAIVRGDGGARGVQGSGILIDDSDNITLVNDITAEGDLISKTFIEVQSAAGVGVSPQSDIDADLLTVAVTGLPKLAWDESEDEFTLSKSLNIDGEIKADNIFSHFLLMGA